MSPTSIHEGGTTTYTITGGSGKFSAKVTNGNIVADDVNFTAQSNPYQHETADGTGTFTVTVTDKDTGATGSATFTVTPNTAPAFTTHPAAPTTATAGTSFTTSPAVVVTGYPAPTLKWQEAGATGNYSDMTPAQTGTTLTVASPVAGTKRYRVVATNSAGTANSNPITVVTT